MALGPVRWSSIASSVPMRRFPPVFGSGDGCRKRTDLRVARGRPRPTRPANLSPRPVRGHKGPIVGHARPFQSRPPHRPQSRRLLRLLQRDESRDSPRSSKVNPGFHHVTTDRTSCCGRASSGQRYRTSQPVPLRASAVRRQVSATGPRNRSHFVPRPCVVPRAVRRAPGRASCPGPCVVRSGQRNR
jgi:hypothetical protein